MSFENLGLSAELLRALSARGYTEPTPIQTKAIPVVLDGRDVLAAAQTGTGKTAGFTLPLLQRLMAPESQAQKAHQPRALVLVPTRELAAQVAESVSTYGAHLPLRSAVIFDLDNDGTLEVAVSRLNGPAALFVKKGGADHNWIVLDLEGTRSNRDGIGARVRLELPSGRSLHEHVTTAHGIYSASDKRVHFGLGSASLVDRVTVTWPSGQRQHLTDVPVNQIVDLVVVAVFQDNAVDLQSLKKGFLHLVRCHLAHGAVVLHILEHLLDRVVLQIGWDHLYPDQHKEHRDTEYDKP